MQYTVTIVRNSEGLCALEAPWSRLLGRSQAASIFTSFPWNAAWWHAFGGQAHRRLYVLVASDTGGEVRGIAPLMLTQSGVSRRLQWIGTSLSDTGDFLLDEECAGPVAEAMFAYLQRHRRDWDLMDLDEVPPYSPLARWLVSHVPPGMRALHLPRTVCPYITLPSSWQEYVSTLERKPRQQLESLARRGVAETGTCFNLVTGEPDVQGAVDRFYMLHRARWASKEEQLNPEHTEAAFLPFLQEACKRAAQHGLLRLAELGVDDRTISSWIAFQVNGRWNGYLTGFDPTWSGKRPGKALHGYVVRQALSEHARELDLGRGDEPYKYELGAVGRTNRRIILASDTARSALMFGRSQLRMRAKDIVRSTRASSL
ncbi:MAG: GNAT family N-acetyltransferase [Chloroflexia bacterium]